MSFEIWNRRYTGSKYKLAEWISNLLVEHCKGDTFCDLFAGTAIVSKQMLNLYKTIYINDFLYSNEIIYKAFFAQQPFSQDKLTKLKQQYLALDVKNIKDNYVSINYGDKFFSYNDALQIGYIREDINKNKDLSEKEKNIMLASLLYSLDRAANTVGHYEAYIKGKLIKDSFHFDLINPYVYTDKNIIISRRDANDYALDLNCDICYIDPPYSSRQYSRFYHVLENIAQWKKPELFGVACKPAPENMSDYCRSTATKVFEDLINKLNTKYIVVSYNNTYNSKSSSSENKIKLEDMENILKSKGELLKFEKEHPYFNAGKSSLENHKEIVYITKVGK